VEELIAQASGSVHVMVEIDGQQVEEGIGAIDGVRGVVRRKASGDGRTALMVTTAGGRDLRPEIFAMARDRGWTLYELHQEAQSLEDLFLQVTGDAPDGAEGLQDEGGAQ
jgi:ABC-2 type transport system ATP-binding protein